jgi:amino acid adenylation domain-containing protein
VATSIPILTEQQVIRAKCFHPTGTFVEFTNDEIEQSIPERFEKIVRLYPERLAVKRDDHAVTYKALNEAANRIAHAILKQRSTGSEPIALVFEHGIDVIAAILGTLKAGKFYVALDSSFPAERMLSILQDSEAALIVSNDHNIGVAHQLTQDSRALLNIDEIDSSVASDDPAPSALPESLVNIRYTSGSTGEPKGIVKTHQQALYHMAVGAAERQISINDRLTLVHSVAFASATTHLFQSLLNGASLFPFDVKAEGISRLLEWLHEEQITVCDLPPSLFRQLAPSLQTRTPPSSLRLITLQSAPVSQEDFNLYKKYFGRGTLLQLAMGSTETGMISSAIVDHNFSFPKEGTPVGYACRGKKILLLDASGREVGPDNIGEIAVKSRHLSQGYWRRPEPTGAKFIPDTDGGDERIYLTGDLGRMLADGFLIHHGRKDFQVKIRGYRVETGEVEAALLGHASVKDAVVVAQDDVHQEKRLVAYVVPFDNPAPGNRELQTFLHNKLPDYMVPSVFVTLDALPLTLNGKVDRKALPAPEKIRPDQKEIFAAPRNPTEARLADMWAELFGVEPVGIHDNFFDLGGHSLTAAQLFAAIEKEFRVPLPLSSLFEGATIEHLARLLSQKNLRMTTIVPIQPRGASLPFFCVHDLFGDVFCYRRLAHYLGQAQPFYGLQPQGLDGLEEPCADITAMAAHYVEAIRAVQPKGPYALGGLSFGGVVAFEMARQLRTKGEEVATVALFDSHFPRGKITLSWGFAPNLFNDFPSWLIGFLQLNRAQWLSLIRSKIAIAKRRLRGALPSSAEKSQQDAIQRRIEELDYLSQFSEQHHKVARAQYQALSNYRLRTYPGRLTLFRARMQPLFSSHAPDNGWGGLAAGGLNIRIVPGNHLGMLQEPHVKVLAEELRSCLDQAQA